MDRPSTYRKDDPLPRGLDNVPWKTHPAVMWLEVTEPTLDNLHAAIDRHLIRGVGYRHLVGATRYGSLLLLDSPEDPLPLSEMVVLYNDTQVRIWWGQCPATEPMDLLFRRHRTSESEPGTPAPLIYAYAGRDNRDDPNPVAREEPEDQLETDSGDGSNGGQPESSPTTRKRGAPQGSQTSRTAKASTRAPQRPRDGQPESSATAAKRGAPQEPQTPRTLRTYGTAQTSGTAKASTGTPRRTRNRGGLDGAGDTEPDDSESDFAEIRDLSLELAPESEVMSHVPRGKQRSAPLPEARVLRSGREIPEFARDQTNRKKAPTRTPINSSSKRDRAAMTGGADPERPADILQTPRKRVRWNETPPAVPNTDSDAGSQPVEVQEPLGNASSPVSPSPEASDPPVLSAEDLVMELREAAEQLQTEASREQASREQAAPPPLSTSTSPPRVSAEDMMMELRRSADLLLGLASGNPTEESRAIGGL